MKPGPKKQDTVLFQTIITPKQKSALEKIAARRGCSISQVVRDMIDRQTNSKTATV